MTTKMTTTLNFDKPIRGVEYDKARPETREAWLDQRRGGLTATEARDCLDPTKRRKIIIGKVTGEFEDLSHIAAVNHGNLREPILAEWIQQNFGIEPCDYVYSRADNPRHLASPDGISLDPFTGELIVGTVDAVLAEIKASKHDLHPGEVDAAGVLVSITPGSQFDRSNYYIQMQWQMYVMNATRTLFVWEQRNDEIDPETGTYSPIKPPQHVWIPRDEKLIQRYVNEVAPKMIEEIDLARATAANGMPPASNVDPAIAALVSELLAARDAEAVAKKRKEKAWKELQDIYMAVPEGAEHPEDVHVDLGFGQITVNTTTKRVMEFNAEAAEKRAPQLVAKYNALKKRYTKPVDKASTSFTVTAKKAE